MQQWQANFFLDLISEDMRSINAQSEAHSAGDLEVLRRLDKLPCCLVAVSGVEVSHEICEIERSDDERSGVAAAPGLLDVIIDLLVVEGCCVVG